jgi:hypothetical protein
MSDHRPPVIMGKRSLGIYSFALLSYKVSFFCMYVVVLLPFFSTSVSGTEQHSHSYSLSSRQHPVCSPYSLKQRATPSNLFYRLWTIQRTPFQLMNGQLSRLHLRLWNFRSQMRIGRLSPKLQRILCLSTPMAIGTIRATPP